MGRKGIKDKVAIIGADMCKFGELWGKNQFDLLFEAVQSATKMLELPKMKLTVLGLVFFITSLVFLVLLSRTS